jgi:hypothetical protein
VSLSIEDLKKQRRWVLWRLESREAKETKVPYQRNGYGASSTDPSTWATFDEVEEHAHKFSGVGVVLGELDGVHVFGVDIDNCCDAATRKWTPESREIVIGLDSYSEFSPSGTGCHILGIGDLAGRKGMKEQFPGCKAIELYDSARYLTFTGRHLSKTPSGLVERKEAVNALYDRVAAAKPKKAALTVAVSVSEEERLKKLMAGDMSDHGDDHSKADFALCCLLAKKHDCNAFKIDETFRESGLYREKWERSDYRERTITMAIKSVIREVPFVDDSEDEMGEDGPDEFLVESLEPGRDGWFPLAEISLIGGPSGIGKTGWTMPLLENIRHGRDVWGHRTTPREYRVLLSDRSKKATRRTARALGLSAEAMERVIRLKSAQQKQSPAEVLQAAIDACPGVEVWFVEGLDLWIPDMNKMQVVSSVIDDLQRVATRYNVAVLGSVGSPKQKGRDKYFGRDALFGSSALARKVETVTLLSLHDETDPNSTRVCWVMSRTGAAEVLYFQWGNGGLVQVEKPEDKTSEPNSAALAKMHVAVSNAFTLDEPLKHRPSLGSESTFNRWRDWAHEKGLVTRNRGKFYLSASATGVELSG